MNDLFSLGGKTALITGGSRGIGLAMARGFVEAGARVILTARDEARLQAAAGSLGANAIGLACDQTRIADVKAAAARSWELGPIDILINNAGVSPYYKRAEFVTEEEFDQVADVNLRGVYFWSVEIATRMMEAGRPGSIVNIGSVGGEVPLDRLAVYSATKAAVHHLTRVLALEWAQKGIRVNAVAPGWTETDFTGDLFASRHGERLLGEIPLGRYATADEVTGAALFLASEASSYVTGIVLPVDGGRALR